MKWILLSVITAFNTQTESIVTKEYAIRANNVMISSGITKQIKFKDVSYEYCEITNMYPSLKKTLVGGTCGDLISKINEKL